jgi:hypothetical protein
MNGSENNINMDLYENALGCGLDSVEGSCEQDNKISGSIKVGEFN